MKNKLFKIIIITTFLISLFISFVPKKVNAVTFPYPDDVVENLGSVIASEIGCADSKEHFVYELIWAGVFVNNYNFWIERSKTPSTVVFTTKNMCDIFGLGKVYSPSYCYYTYAKRAANRGSDCTPEQKYQTNLAAKMVLAKSFNIPRNITYAAEGKYANTDNNVVWADFQPTINGRAVGMHTYFSTDNKKQPATQDVYGNTISNDLAFYKKLATCLYNNPTLFYAYNKCSTTPTTYKVYLYPNGGTGIKDKYELEYTNRKVFTDFPTVTKANCELDGWNRDSVNGTQYKTDVGPEDNGKNFYARWVCQESSSNSSSSKSSSSSNSIQNKKITVTFKMNNGTNTIFWSDVINTNELVTEPKNKPTRDGYTFDGWITEDNKKFDFKTQLTEDLTLYAKWKKLSEFSKESNQSQETLQSKITPSTSSQTSEGTINPQTGMFGLIIFVVLMIPTSLAVFVYYQNYIIKSKSQQS